ncbi:MAG: deoxyribodipyrimidine photolyase [Acidobacteriota bacterium]|nr:deoxyribodipyrimidine photolyase [Acidobacteriota bacterium]
MEQRIRLLNDAPVARHGRYVLYWCRWNRRADANHALAFAAGVANRMNLPLVVYQRAASHYPSACDRFHAFELEGVPEFAQSVRALGAGYVFQLPRGASAGTVDRRAMFDGAALVVTDDCLRATPPLDRQLIAVDASCIVPAGVIGQRCYAAYSIRPRIHKVLARYLHPVAPVELRRACKENFAGLHTEVTPDAIPALTAACAVDHSVPPSTIFRGGRAEALRCLNRFLDERLHRYARDKNEPSAHATSGLSPYLHYGYISALEVALAVTERARERKLIADEFLEELIVRRELAWNFARYAPRLDSLDVLPEWARKTIHDHRRDERPYLYTGEQFDSAATHDDLWNATQRELRLRGTIHGYYRMYWGKKILEWSPSAAAALATMLRLHDRYALDGDDPNTYTNILWCFGLHDRPWPERPVFGTIRSMVRSGMERKTDTRAYIREIGFLERTGKEPNG